MGGIGPTPVHDRCTADRPTFVEQHERDRRTGRDVSTRDAPRRTPLARHYCDEVLTAARSLTR
jgi:hypothetical protein